MNSWGDNPIGQVRSLPGDLPPGIGPIEEPDEQVNIFVVIHRTMRGRYIWAIVLAILFGTAGTVGGYRFKEPLFMSIGHVRVQRKVEGVLYTLREGEEIRAFDQAIRTEMQFVQSQRVISLAATDPKLLEAGWPEGGAGVSRLKNELYLEHNRGEEVFLVGIEDPDRHMAMHAVNAVLDAYNKIYGDETAARIKERMKKIDEEKRNLERELDQSRAQVSMLSEQFGTPELEQLHDAKLNDLIEVNKTLADIEQQIMAIDLGSDQAADPDADGEDEQELTIELLASADPELAALVAALDGLETTLESMEAEYGPRHVEVRRMQRQIEQKKGEVDRRADDLRKLVENDQLTLNSPVLDGSQSLEQLKNFQKRYLALREERTRELQQLSSARDQIAALREQQARILVRLDEASTELYKINLEGQRLDSNDGGDDAGTSRGRISTHHGGLPSQPSSDKRLQFAVLGGGAGFFGGFGIIWLFAMLRPSYRYIDELERNENLPILGTLPDLSDPRQGEMAMASLSIHHLRNVLTLRARNTDGLGTSYMISSARPADGKTSLALALAMSFASEGNRTVMLDADLVGRGLSRSLELDELPGMTDLLEHHTLDGCVHTTHVPNMWAVPAGAAGGRKPEELSVGEFRRVVEHLKSQFDTVIVDTGPLMGSLEANLGAAIVDFTILTVSRGQDPRVVKAAIRRLEQIGGRCAGLVFNKASHRDLTSNVTQVSFHSQSIRPEATASKRGSSETIANPLMSQGDRKALVRALMEQAPEPPKESTGEWALAE